MNEDKDTNEIINNKKLKTINVLSKTSLIMYTCILVLMIISLIVFYNENSGSAGWIIIIFVIQTFIPLVACSVLSIIASSIINKCKKSGINIPKKIKIIEKINAFQIPLIILVFIIGLSLKNSKYNKQINQKLDEIYNSKYKIISKYSNSNEGGDNSDIVIVELEEFAYPVTCRFDWKRNGYEDNYEELMKADMIKYHEYIDSIFNDKIISLMNIYDDEDNKRIDLKIIITDEYLSNGNLNILKNYANQIVNKYASQLPDYYFSFNIFFSKKIDEKLVKDYYIFFSEFSDYQIKTSEKIYSSIIRVIDIYIDENTNIKAEINDSFYDAFDSENMYINY